MNNFDSLNPALQHHIVNSLGWKELRPFQDAAIPQVLSGEHSIILAPTAGGKTESAILPVLSQILSVPWEGLSVLYICPMKALLNDLGERLDRYFSLVGRRASVWHGDISRTAKDRIVKEPPNLLLTTPESLEAILVSARIDGHAFFSSLKATIVDEIHLFAGADRGWHLLALLARLKRISGNEFQRIGLSATVGNPDYLARWLTGGCELDVKVLVPEASSSTQSDVQLDYVGSLDNAAIVVSRMYRGEKRLVFVDSRARAEQLADALRRLEVNAYVTHSSLSRDERSRAERAFQSEDNCVIVATSVLEVGVDVGDLDRVIQIDAPGTVSSFLQRLGRTGRRKGSTRNCLFLATRKDALLRSAAILRLFNRGYVEPIKPPQHPFHIVAQQLLALCLQESGIGRQEWFDWIRDVSGFASLDVRDLVSLVDWMITNEILFEDQGILGIGPKGEQAYGRKNFLDLVSVFVSPPIFTVLSGKNELGYVDERVFIQKDTGDSKVLLLGGRAWLVKHVDWKRRQVFVEPTEETGGTRWTGVGVGLDFALCQAMKYVLSSDMPLPSCSQRATKQLDLLREEFSWISHVSDSHLVSGNATEWWTFGGSIANASLSSGLQRILRAQVRHEDLRIVFPEYCTLEHAESAIKQLKSLDATKLYPVVAPEAVEGLKFSDLLPMDLAERVAQSRLIDDDAVEVLLGQSLRLIHKSA